VTRFVFYRGGKGEAPPTNCRPSHVQDGYGVACLPLGLGGLSKANSARGIVNCETPQFKQIETSGKTKTPGPVRFSRLETWRSISAGNSARRSEPHDGQGITDSHGRGSSSVNSLTLHPRTRSCKLRRRDWCRRGSNGGGKPAHSGGPLFFFSCRGVWALRMTGGPEVCAGSASERATLRGACPSRSPASRL
jgi:hypothetical protein